MASEPDASVGQPPMVQPKRNTRTGSYARATFRRSERLRRSVEFQRVFREGLRVVGDRVVLFGWRRTADRATPFQRPRLGISVPRQYGTAVQRNRFKRVVREVFRLNKQRLHTDVDVIVLPKGDAVVEYRSLERELVTLWQRARVLRPAIEPLVS